MEKIAHLEALLFTAVLENCVDQLSILGHIMPVAYNGKTDLSHTGSQEIKEVMESQKKLDISNQEVTSAKRGSGETDASKALKSIGHKKQQGKPEDLKSAHHPSSKAMKQNALFIENLRKIQADRQYASDVITVTMKRLQESGTYNSLIEANEREKAKKSKFHDVLLRSEEEKRKVKALEKQLQDVKKETEIELQIRDDTIAQLKDELQDLEAKTEMESRYMKKSSDFQVQQTQMKCSSAENVLNKEIQKLRTKTEEENRVHMETEKFLRRRNEMVEEKLEYWIDKYENDMDAKEKELDALKASRANDLELTQRTAKECLMFEITIIGDREERADKKRKEEREELELKSILKLQAWWKGTMVRKNLGPYQGLGKWMEKQLLKKKEKGKK
ncbi:DRC9 protein, partial [Centropus bengalensis]|nr:DRC9 protein [Centropus bengalensis]